MRVVSSQSPFSSSSGSPPPYTKYGDCDAYTMYCSRREKLA